MPELPEYQIEQLLSRWAEGETGALSKLMPLVFEDLQMIASRNLAAFSNSDLEANELVAELYIRVAQRRQMPHLSYAAFLGYCSTLMRRVLVDIDRHKRAGKRGGGGFLLPLSEAAEVAGNPPNLDAGLELEAALNALGKYDEQAEFIVRMKFLYGYSLVELADLLDMSLSTLKRQIRAATTMLRWYLLG